MDIKGMGSYSSYNFYQVSNAGAAKTNQDASNQYKLTMAQRIDYSNERADSLENTRSAEKAVRYDSADQVRRHSDKLNTADSVKSNVDSIKSISNEIETQMSSMKSTETELNQAVKQAKNAQDSVKTQALKKADDTYANLSDKAKEYLSQLKEKFGNVDIYVADNVTDEDAAALMSSGDKTYSALIDSATLEEMANNSDVAASYESLISDSIGELDELKQEYTDKGLNIAGVGVSIDGDGNKTYYSIIDDSLSYYDKQIKEQEAKKAKKAEAQKEEEAKDEKAKELRKEQQAEEAKKKEARAELLKEQQEASEERQSDMVDKQTKSRYKLMTAGTIDDLKRKLEQEADKITSLKRSSSILAGAGIDTSA